MSRVLVVFVSLVLSVSIGSSPSLAGSKKLRRALGIGVAVGAGVAIFNKLQKKKKQNQQNISASTKSNNQTAQSSTSRSTNIAIQKALNAKGFNAGTPDGILGKGSRAAIRNYQASIGEASTGRLTSAQSATLLGGAIAVSTSNTLASSPKMDALVTELFSNSGGLPYDKTDFKVYANGDITFRSHYTRSGKLTGKYDVQHGNVSSLNVGVNFVYGSPGQVGITDIREDRSYDLVVGPQSHTPEQAQAWARQKSKIIAKMAALAGRDFDTNKANAQIASDADSAQHTSAGFATLGGLVRNAPNSSSAPKYTIVEDNTNSSIKNVVIRCYNGSEKSVILQSDGGWTYGLANWDADTFEAAAEASCP